jgi:putative transposase
MSLRCECAVRWRIDSRLGKTTAAGTVIHSDQGLPGGFHLIRFSQRLADAHIAASVGSIGDSCDNALAETINRLYKTELIRPQGRWRTVDQVELATAQWVDWVNHRRLYGYCVDIPPAELEADYYRQHRAQQPAELSHH